MNFPFEISKQISIRYFYWWFLFDHYYTGNQSFYLEHTDDIICLTVNEHPKYKNVVATGQIGAQPEVNVWDASTKTTLSVLKGFHTKGVCYADFSCSGKLLLTVGIDDNHSVAVWRWQDGEFTKFVSSYTQFIIQGWKFSDFSLISDFITLTILKKTFFKFHLKNEFHMILW